jgi:hypothetical protein
MEQGDLAGARPLYERALAIREKAFGLRVLHFKPIGRAAGTVGGIFPLGHYFTNSLTLPARLGLLIPGSAAASLGRAARGSVAPRKVACRAAAGGRFIRGSRSSTRARGQLHRCPF